MNVTNTRYIDPFGINQFFVSYPNMNSNSCLIVKKNDWINRTYYEAKDCLENGGYILYDTLTYRNENLPWLHDFIASADNALSMSSSCYNSEIISSVMPFVEDLEKDGYVLRSNSFPNLFPSASRVAWDYPCCYRPDVTLFIKRLFMDLKRRGYDVKSENFRYLICSEHGSKKKTFRPHNHALFFVNVYGLQPLELSQAITLCWYGGITDGFPSTFVPSKHRWMYKDRNYVLEHNTFRKMNDVTLRTIKYVAKYVSKNMYNDRILRDRLRNTFDILFPYWERFPDQRQLFNRVVHNCLPFHSQSQGFGKCLLDMFDSDELGSIGYPSIPDDKGVVHRVKLSGYLLRKYAYETYKDFDGKLCWRIKSDKVDWRITQIKNNINRLAYKIHSIMDCSLDYARCAARYSILYRGVVAHPVYFSMSVDEYLRSKLSKDLNLTKLVNGEYIYNVNDRDHRKYNKCHVHGCRPRQFSWDYDEFLFNLDQFGMQLANDRGEFAHMDSFLEQFQFWLDWFDSMKLKLRKVNENYLERCFENGILKKV